MGTNSAASIALGKEIAYRASGSETTLLQMLHDAGAAVLRTYQAPAYQLATDDRRNLLQVHVRFPDGTMGYFSPGGPPRVWTYVFVAGHASGDEELPGVDPWTIASTRQNKVGASTRSPSSARIRGHERAKRREDGFRRHEHALRRLTITTAMARALFVDTWATYEEERGRSFSGQQLMDVAPATPSPARAAAKVLAKKIELTNGASLTDLYDRAVTVGGKEDPDAFGHYLAMQALGHGVSWFDRNPEFPLVVPSFEFAKTSARHYYFPRS